MLSQFTPEAKYKTLADLYDFPKDVYPVGRLDTDSEGLLILTDNKSLNYELLHPSRQHKRTYWVQVEGEITEQAISDLEKGVELSIMSEKFFTRPATARKINAPDLPERVPPVRYRKNKPTSWIELSLIEGKNRQVRRMTAVVGFPTLRLVRSRIEDLTIDGMKPGDVNEVDEKDLFKKLKIKIQ